MNKHFAFVVVVALGGAACGGDDKPSPAGAGGMNAGGMDASGAGGTSGGGVGGTSGGGVGGTSGGGVGCDWIKLPDSLCPETMDERDLWGCHLGAEGNVNGEDGYPSALNCTPDAPTVAQDPDMGVMTTGQCCDPLGDADAANTLPACNAYRTVGKFVAAAGEITDDPRPTRPPVCASEPAAPCVNQGDINPACPFNLPPIDGSCAPTGECCHRASNAVKIDMLGPDESAQIEYRLNFVDITNHPDSIGLPDLTRTAAERAAVCSGEQCLLWRFTVPRAGGEFIPGMGTAEIGIGAYNCDGTFSFYGSGAAEARPEIGETDPGRWQAVEVPIVVDPTKSGTDRYHIPWATNKNREIARSIFLFPMDNSIDWELASSGFEITELDTSEAGLDCNGTRSDDFVTWNTVAGFVAYSPMKGNEKDIANQINQTYCSLLAFGLLPEGMKDTDCLTTPRCIPDDIPFDGL